MSTINFTQFTRLTSSAPEQDYLVGYYSLSGIEGPFSEARWSINDFQTQVLSKTAGSHFSAQAIPGSFAYHTRGSWNELDRFFYINNDRQRIYAVGGLNKNVGTPLWLLGSPLPFYEGSEETPLELRSKIKIFEPSLKIVQAIACERRKCLVLLNDGTVWHMGVGTSQMAEGWPLIAVQNRTQNWTNGFYQIYFSDLGSMEKIVRIGMAGYAFANPTYCLYWAITNQNNLYLWGEAVHARFSFFSSNSNTKQWTPVKITAPSDLVGKVADVFVAGTYEFAIYVQTTENKLYAAGLNIQRRLANTSVSVGNHCLNFVPCYYRNDSNANVIVDNMAFFPNLSGNGNQTVARYNMCYVTQVISGRNRLMVSGYRENTGVKPTTHDSSCVFEEIPYSQMSTEIIEEVIFAGNLGRFHGDYGTILIRLSNGRVLSMGANFSAFIGARLNGSSTTLGPIFGDCRMVRPDVSNYQISQFGPNSGFIAERMFCVDANGWGTYCCFILARKNGRQYVFGAGKELITPLMWNFRSSNVNVYVPIELPTEQDEEVIDICQMGRTYPTFLFLTNKNRIYGFGESNEILYLGSGQQKIVCPQRFL